MFSKLMRMTLILGLAVAVTVFTVEGVSAQTGTISGLVTAQSTAGPLQNVQVSIADLNVGSLTSGNGRYLLLAVPVGTYDLTVTMIGYGEQTVQVTVAAEQTTEANFELGIVALNLDEIVVTGTGAPTQRRRLVATITTISSEELATAPITNLADALIGRLPGARGLISGGQTGAGSQIVLRGTASISQRQDPLIYVDGIRIDNRPEDARSVTTDRLMDINPQDIDRIEIIKGAAAATLYGTEASSGVIQIFTKRGITGAPRYTFSTDHQKLEFPRRFEDNCAYVGSSNSITCNYPYDNYEVFAYHQNYNLSVRGGTPKISYYVSGRVMEEVNPSPNNELLNKSIRASFDFNNTERLTSSVDFSFVDRALVTADPGWGDVFGNLMLGNPLRAGPDNPDGAYSPTKKSLVTENNQNSQNFLVNGRMTYQWTDNIQSTMRVGYNFIDSRLSSFYPQGVVASSVRAISLCKTGGSRRQRLTSVRTGNSRSATDSS